MAPRICGICSVSHACAALRATEAALGIRISGQTLLLRRLAFHGEVISSHILHIYYLAGPDFLGFNSIFPLAQVNKDAVLRAMRLKQLGYDVWAAVVGRHTHPVGMKVGGFWFVHSQDELMKIRHRLCDAVVDMRETARLFATLDFPQFERETEYVALTHPETYVFYDGELVSSTGGRISAKQYRDVIKEYVVSTSTAKHAKWNGPHYMVGALARLNTNFKQLSPLAKELAYDRGLDPPCHNPFMNTAAQIVECGHCIEESIEIIDEICDSGIKAEDELARVETRRGAGVGAVEAPRGTLFHEYHYDDRGICQWANHLIPTAQNLATLGADMHEMVSLTGDFDEDFITERLEMLVRAYDPCISCSTHRIKLDCVAE